MTKSLEKIWFVFLRPLAQKMLSALISREGSLTIGFHCVRFGWISLVEEIGQEPKVEDCSLPDAIFPSRKLHHAFAPRAVWRLKNAAYDLSGGTVYLNRTAVSESFQGSALKFARRVRAARASPMLPIRGDVIPAGQRHQNYYHWLIEDLPAILRGLEYAKGAAVAVRSDSPKYVWQSLTYFGVSNLISVKKSFSAESLIVAGREKDAGWPHPLDIEILRSHLSRTLTDVPATSRAVYISRRHSRRAFANSSTIEEELGLVGVETVYLENMAFNDQVELFQTARVVIADHGAGLANIALGSPHTIVIEIVTPDRAIQCFESVSSLLGQRYYRFLTSSVSGPGLKLHSDELNNLVALVEANVTRSVS